MINSELSPSTLAKQSEEETSAVRAILNKKLAEWEEPRSARREVVVEKRAHKDSIRAWEEVKEEKEVSSSSGSDEDRPL